MIRKKANVLLGHGGAGTEGFFVNIKKSKKEERETHKYETQKKGQIVEN